MALRPIQADSRLLRDSAAARWQRGGSWLDDSRLRWLEILLDEAFTIPGTSIRFGIDGIVGLIPGLGDILAGAFSLIIPLAAWIRGVPYITLLRMLTNVAIGLIVGTIPIAGDAFDIFWKANHRNYQLMVRSIGEPRRHTWRDWVYLLALAISVGAVFAIPFVLCLLVLGWLAGLRITH